MCHFASEIVDFETGIMYFLNSRCSAGLRWAAPILDMFEAVLIQHWGEMAKNADFSSFSFAFFNANESENCKIETRQLSRIAHIFKKLSAFICPTPKRVHAQHQHGYTRNTNTGTRATPTRVNCHWKNKTRWEGYPKTCHPGSLWNSIHPG